MNQPRKGCPSIFTPNVVKTVHQVIKLHNDATSEEISTRLVKRYGRKYISSASSIRKLRVKLGYTRSQGLGQDELSEEHKKKRVFYCKQHLRDKFSNVVFSDEKPWLLGKLRRPLWRRPGSARPTFWKTKYPTKIQCWGGISFQGKTELRIWIGRQPSTHYIDTLDRYLLPYATTHMGKR